MKIKIYAAPFSKMALIPAGCVPVSIEWNPPIPYGGVSYKELMDDYYQRLKEEMEDYGYTGLTCEDFSKMSATHQEYVIDSFTENFSEAWDEREETIVSGSGIYKALTAISSGNDVCILCCEPMCHFIKYWMWNHGNYEVILL